MTRESRFSLKQAWLESEDALPDAMSILAGGSADTDRGTGVSGRDQELAEETFREFLIRVCACSQAFQKMLCSFYTEAVYVCSKTSQDMSNPF